MFLPGSSTAPIVRGTAEAAAMGPRGKGRREQGGVRPKCPFLFTSQLAASQQVLVASYCNRGASNPCAESSNNFTIFHAIFTALHF